MEQRVESSGTWSAPVPRRTRIRRPRQGDVVVEPHGQHPAAFRIRAAPTCRTMTVTTPVRLTAIALARRFAAADRVDLWYLEGEHYRLLEVYRRDEGPARPVRAGTAGAR